MAKSRIAPLNKVSTPRMELNGAVLSKLCRAAIQSEMRYKFKRVLHLVDSATVLSMIHKTSYRFKAYEGVRIGEIQAATNGDVSEWAWSPGSKNTADWLTHGRLPTELQLDSEWFKGPPMLSLPFDDWDIRFKAIEGTLPGEKKLSAEAYTAKSHQRDTPLFDCSRVSKLNTALQVVARILNIARLRFFMGGKESLITSDSVKEARDYIILEAQRSTDIGGKDYLKLNPAQREDGIWVVGSSRLAKHNPLNAIHAELPVFLPHGQPFTHFAMEAAHRNGHRGRDATLAMFRSKYWTPLGPALAEAMRNKCQLCKLRDASSMQQEMGRLPLERLMPSPPFSNYMVDLFGPYKVRGEVQKRITGKAWGVIFTDMCSSAVHIEAMYDYSTSSFLLALSRFASIRGWPQKI